MVCIGVASAVYLKFYVRFWQFNPALAGMKRINRCENTNIEIDSTVFDPELHSTRAHGRGQTEGSSPQAEIRNNIEISRFSGIRNSKNVVWHCRFPFLSLRFLSGVKVTGPAVKQILLKGRLRISIVSVEGYLFE
jgi:hypothetical protein